MPDEVFSRYVVRSRLRVLGLHVTAFRASQQGLDRDVEIRVLPLSAVAGTREPDRFTREFRALATFDHPNLIQVVDVGRTTDHLFYVTYFREARTLEEMFATEIFDEATIAKAARALGAALEYLHAREFVHRSMNSHSIFHDFALDRFYIGDYSSMAPFGPEPDGAPGDLPLLRLAMTPEARSGLPTDARTDLFLLGATLYRMATTVDPMPGLMQAIEPPLSAKVQPASTHRAGLSRELVAFLSRTLEPDPKDRFQTAHDLKAAAEQLLKKLELKAAVERTTDGMSAETFDPGVSRVRLKAASPTADSGSSRPPPRTQGPPPAARPSRERIRAATETATEEAEAAEPDEESATSSAAPIQSGFHQVASEPTSAKRPPLRTRAALAIRMSAKIARVAVAGASGRVMDGVPAAYRVPAAILGCFLCFVVLAVFFSSRSPETAEAESVPVPAPVAMPAAPPTTSVASTGSSESDESAAAVRRLADQVRQTPTDLTNFRDRWQTLRKWYVVLPPAQRAEAFAYDRLLKAKIDFAADPTGACKLLDDLYDKAGPQIR